MTITYPAVFRKTENGYRADFPDLDQCYAEGRTLDDCIDDAIEACRSWIMVELDDTYDLPPVTDPEDLELEEGEFVRQIGVKIRLYDGWDE